MNILDIIGILEQVPFSNTINKQINSSFINFNSFLLRSDLPVHKMYDIKNYGI